MAFSINIGNVTQHGDESQGYASMRAIVDALPITMARVVPSEGYWQGTWEPSATLTVYDDVLPILARMMPNEQGFGLDDEFWPNPYHVTNMAAGA